MLHSETLSQEDPQNKKGLAVYIKAGFELVIY